MGIDVYFPLTDWTSSKYDVDDVIKGFDSGEGYDFYYSGPERSPLRPQYAWKNLNWWWSNYHINPDNRKTSWIPRSKKIWFTEYGFPSVDLATNQPNVFYDPDSVESVGVRHSNHNPDILAQRIGIEAVEKRWLKSNMVENKFLWTWDARPYPTWPSYTEIWADGGCWARGHWVQGKLGCAMLSYLLLSLCKHAGLNENDIDVSRINNVVDGFVVTQHSSIREIISLLQKVYFFDIVESDYKIKFIPRLGKKVYPIPQNDIIVKTKESSTIEISRANYKEIPNQVIINFIDKSMDYVINTQSATRLTATSSEVLKVELPIVMNSVKGIDVANGLLYNAWAERNKYTLSLPFKYSYLVPSDVISIKMNNATHNIRICSIELGKNKRLDLSGVSENISVYNQHTSQNKFEEPLQHKDNTQEAASHIWDTEIEIIDIPPLPHETNNSNRVLVAACGKGEKWLGCKIFYRMHGDTNKSFSFLANISQKSIMGYAVNVLNEAGHYIPDNKNQLMVNLIQGSIHNTTTEQFFYNKSNLALVGNEVIKFRKVKLVGDNQYIISSLMRGLCGTEHCINNHKAGERFVILDDSISSIDIPSKYHDIELELKIVTNIPGMSENNSVQFKKIKYEAYAIKPLSPVNIAINKSRSISKLVTDNKVQEDSGNESALNIHEDLIAKSTKQPEIELQKKSDEVYLISWIPRYIDELFVYKHSTNIIFEITLFHRSIVIERFTDTTYVCKIPGHIIDKYSGEELSIQVKQFDTKYNLHSLPAVITINSAFEI